MAGHVLFHLGAHVDDPRSGVLVTPAEFSAARQRMHDASRRLKAAALAYGEASAAYGLAWHRWYAEHPAEARLDPSTTEPRPAFDAEVMPVLRAANGAQSELLAIARHAFDGAEHVNDPPNGLGGVTAEEDDDPLGRIIASLVIRSEEDDPPPDSERTRRADAMADEAKDEER